MAKQETVSQLIFFGSNLWNFSRNYRKEIDTDKLAKLETLMVPGWRTEVSPVIAMPTGCLDFTEEEAKIEADRRKAKLSEIEADTTDPLKHYRLEAHKLLWCDNKGKVVVPTLAATSCFRRSMAYPNAMMRYLMARKGKGKAEDLPLVTGRNDVPEPITKVPVIIRHFKDETERWDAMIRENGKDTEGRAEVSMTDNLRIAREMYKRLYNESAMRQRFKDAIGIKLYGICFLDDKFPELNLVERMLLPPTPEGNGHIPLASVNFTKMQEYKQRVTDLTAYRKKKDKSDAEPVTAAELSVYFGNPQNNNPIAKKGLARPEWEEFKNRPKLEIMRTIAAAHLDNSKDEIVKLYEFAPVLDLALDLCRNGKMQAALEALKIVV